MTPSSSVIFGRVRDINGNPVSQARVSFAIGPVPLPDIAALTDTKGTFALSAPVPGEYIIQLISEEFVTREIKIEVEANQKKDIDIIMSRRQEI